RRLTTRKRNPLTELEACGIDPDIEDFLQHEIIVYNRKKERQRRNMVNQEIQISDTNTHTCDYEDEINRRVKKELDNFSQ
ncbi:8313_t:CDS:2, partial [Scutellospora calospora]